jgi:prophage maintenance system killer protein
MGKKLTDSAIERQNILNNFYAVQEIQKAMDIRCIRFEDRMWLTKEQVSSFFEVTSRTIDNYLRKFEQELRQNGYEVLKGNRLKELKKGISEQFGDEMGFVTKTTVLGIFDFRAFLNIAMLITESERARLLRQAILDIVIDTINQRTGGGTKYINQRDEDFLIAWFQGENYRKQFTDALRDSVDYYPTFEHKLTHLFFSANKFHCFQDGNKRIAISLGAQFLLLNGHVFVAGRFIREMENISYHVAAGNIDKDLLHEIVCAVINDAMDDESLKLKILNAISEGGMSLN